MNISKKSIYTLNGTVLLSRYTVVLQDKWFFPVRHTLHDNCPLVLGNMKLDLLKTLKHAVILHHITFA